MTPAQYLRLINEGLTFKDKIIIFSYFLRIPIHFIKKRLKIRYSHKLLGSVTVKNKDGIFFCGNNIFSVWTGSSFYEQEIKKHFNLNVGVFIDVGANIGKYSVIIGKQLNKNGRVISFEPMPGNFELLKKNIKLNNLKNVISFECALGYKE